MLTIKYGIIKSREFLQFFSMREIQSEETDEPIIDFKQNVQQIYLKKDQNSKDKRTATILTIIFIFMLLILGIYLFSNRLLRIKEQQKIQQDKDRISSQMQKYRTNILEIQKQTKNINQRLTENQNKLEYILNRLQSIQNDLTNNKYVQKNNQDAFTHKQFKELNFLQKNSKGQTIDEVLYDENQRKKRIQFYNERVQFINSKNAKGQFQSANLIKYNMKIDYSQDYQQKKDEQFEWARLQKIYKLSSTKQELPMCIVTPGYNNKGRFRIQLNLNSIFSLNYTNYNLVLINDASTDGSGEIYKKYFQFYNISKEKYFYIENPKRLTALQNIYIATTKYCKKDSIVVTMDGDDEFIGKNSLKLFNSIYQTRKSGVVYSNFYLYQQPTHLGYGQNLQYTLQQKISNSYRDLRKKFVQQLRSYRAQIFMQVNPNDFKDQNGNFFTITYDLTMFFPMMELSCGRVQYIRQFNYLYNTGTGLNDFNNRSHQIEVENIVRGRKKYQCWKEFDEKMKKMP